MRQICFSNSCRDGKSASSISWRSKPMEKPATLGVWWEYSHVYCTLWRQLDATRLPKELICTWRLVPQVEAPFNHCGMPASSPGWSWCSLEISCFQKVCWNDPSGYELRICCWWSEAILKRSSSVGFGTTTPLCSVCSISFSCNRAIFALAPSFSDFSCCTENNTLS